MGEASTLGRAARIAAGAAMLVACRQGGSASSLAADARATTTAIAGADVGPPPLDDSVPRFERPDPHRGVESLAFAPDATALAVASSTMTVWDLVRGAVRFSVAIGWTEGHGLAWSPDGTHI